MEFSSFVVVRSKSGELEALRNVEPEEARAVRICIDLVADGSTSLRSIAEVVEYLQRCGQIVLLDATKLHRSSRLWEYPGGPVNAIAQYLTEGPERQLRLDPELPFVPVLSLTAADQELRTVALLREAYGCSLGIRVPVLFPAVEAAARIEHFLGMLRLDSGAVELIVDAGFLSGGSLVADSSRLITELGARFVFESVTLLSGSIPAKRGKLEPGVFGRPEFDLWQQVRACASALRYGDYGIVHPRAPEPVKPGVPMNIPNPYLFYTGVRRIRYARRNMVRGANRRPLAGEDPAAYFSEVAQETVMSQEYEQSTTASWGDRRLWHCANGDVAAARSPDWIAIGTSHHIAHLAGHGDLAPD